MLTIIWQRRVVTNFQFVKTAVPVKHDKVKHSTTGMPVICYLTKTCFGGFILYFTNTGIGSLESEIKLS